MLRKFNNSTILRNAPKTFVTSDINAGVNEIPVANAQYVQDFNYIILEQIPSEKFEILEIDDFTGDTVELVSGDITRYPHSYQTVAYFVKSNSIEFSRSEDVFGAKTMLAELPIAGSEEYTIYSDDTNTTGFGFIRLFADKTPKEYEAYSSPNPYEWDRYTAREIKASALGILNKEYSTVSDDDSFLFRQMNDCESYVMNSKGRSNYSFLVKHDLNLGFLNEGGWKLPLPKDIQDDNTNESIVLVRMGKNELRYLDPQQWREMTWNTVRTDITFPVAPEATEIIVEDTKDFDDEGELVVGSQRVSYTGKQSDRFTGVTGVETGIPQGATIFSVETFGQPVFFTVQNGTIYTYPITSEREEGNVYITYKRKVANISKLYDRTVLPDPTAMVDYLCAKIQQRLNDGAVDSTVQVHMQNFEQKVIRMLRYDKSGRDKTFRASIRKPFSIRIKRSDYDN